MILGFQRLKNNIHQQMGTFMKARWTTMKSTTFTIVIATTITTTTTTTNTKRSTS
jgi:hypothetical protein